jgi:hypothetical protein
VPLASCSASKPATARRCGGLQTSLNRPRSAYWERGEWWVAGDPGIPQERVIQTNKKRLSASPSFAFAGLLAACLLVGTGQFSEQGVGDLAITAIGIGNC